MKPSSPAATRTKARAFYAVKLLLAVAVLAALYAAADWTKVGRVLATLDARWLTAAMLLFVPQTLVSAWRWQGLAGGVSAISLPQACQQTLAASALNLLLPSKLGDLSKAAMLPGSPAMRSTAPLVIIEKGSDVAALLVLLALGTLGVGPWLLAALVVATALVALWGFGRRSPGLSSDQPAEQDSLSRSDVPRSWLQRLLVVLTLQRSLAVAATSLLLWMLHLAQFDFFLRAAGVDAGLQHILARIPLAIFAGLLPFTLWGVGARDTALVWLFADLAPAPVMAGVGLLTALRYAVPGLLGVPCLRSVWPAREASMASYFVGKAKQAA